ncbi:MAG: DUF882 domain-containing protein [Deltaproteobacteria bacterium]|nr:MAG: DUF882 domain-containing protein [Deltaproteobacteria bacterium]
MHNSLKTTCDFLSSAIPTRRQVLKAGLVASAMLLAPWQAWAKVGKALADLPERTISLYNAHTGEMLSKFVYWQDGNYIKEALDEISYLLRDHRTDEVLPFDPAVIDQAFAISRKIEKNQPFEIFSGFRSEMTNKQLRNRSRRVAKHSLHIEAKALDLRLPSVPIKQLRAAALSLREGGVGYYPQRGFVHIDSGPVRSW